MKWFFVHHIKDDSGLEHLIASMQLKKYSEDYSKHSTEHLKHSKTPLEVLEACNTGLRRVLVPTNVTTESQQ